MSFNNKQDRLAFGPLGSASLGADEFGFNLYFSYLFDESLKKHQELQDEYEQALQDNDYSMITRVQNEIAVQEGLFNLTLTYNFDGKES